jgi:hypothetical protein
VESTAIGDGFLFDLASLGEDALAAPEVDIGRRQIVQPVRVSVWVIVVGIGSSMFWVKLSILTQAGPPVT